MKLKEMRNQLEKELSVADLTLFEALYTLVRRRVFRTDIDAVTARQQRGKILAAEVIGQVLHA